MGEDQCQRGSYEGGQAITHPPFLSAGHESKPGFPRDKGGGVPGVTLLPISIRRLNGSETPDTAPTLLPKRGQLFLKTRMVRLAVQAMRQHLARGVHLAL